MKRAVSIVLFALLPISCVPDEALDPACLEQPATLAIGDGVQDFAELSAGAPLDVYLGPQGGYHALLGVRGSGIEPDVHISVQVIDLETDRELASTEQDRVLRLVDDACTLESVDLLTVLDIDSVEEIEHHDALVSVVVEDGAGRRASADITVDLGVWR